MNDSIALTRMGRHTEEELELAHAAEEERTLYSLMIRLRLGDLATGRRRPFVARLGAVLIACIPDFVGERRTRKDGR